eukprot:COSAG02_NODE_5600_length_4198_cov_8.658858_2_plen_425_part_00
MARKRHRDDADTRKMESLQGKAGFTSISSVQNAQSASCYISTDSSQGSGVLVDGSSVGLPRACILTNHHVVPSMETAQRTSARFYYKENGNPAEWLTVPMDPGSGFIAHKDDNLDFCLVAISSVGKFANLPTPLQMQPDAHIGKGVPTSICQHPGGCWQTQTLWVADQVDENTLTYENDTAPGSSGAPIFNHQSELVGVHYAGGTRRNYGCRLSAIIRYIRNDHANKRSKRSKASNAVGDAEFQVADQVVIHGLTGATELNGMHAIVTEYVEHRSRFTVIIEQHGLKRVRATNLRRLSDSTASRHRTRSSNFNSPGSQSFKFGDQVMVDGLTGATELNGKSGIVAGFIAQTTRYTVVVEAYGPKKVRAANLRPVLHLDDQVEVPQDGSFAPCDTAFATRRRACKVDATDASEDGDDGPVPMDID